MDATDGGERASAFPRRETRHRRVQPHAHHPTFTTTISTPADSARFSSNMPTTEELLNEAQTLTTSQPQRAEQIYNDILGVYYFGGSLECSALNSI